VLIRLLHSFNEFQKTLSRRREEHVKAAWLLWIALFLSWGSLLQAQREPGAEYDAIPTPAVPKKIKAMQVGARTIYKEQVADCFRPGSQVSEKKSAWTCGIIADAYEAAGDIQAARMYWKYACSEYYTSPCLQLAHSFPDVETKRYVLDHISGCYNKPACEAALAESFELEQPINKEAAAFRYSEACAHSLNNYRPDSCWKACDLKPEFEARSQCFTYLCVDGVGNYHACEAACEGAPNSNAYDKCLDLVGKVVHANSEDLRQERQERIQQSQH
jgi:hypothetical protein